MKRAAGKVFFVALGTLLPLISFAATQAPYVPLEPIAGFPTGSNVSLPAFLNKLFDLLLQLGAVTAVVMIAVGGFQYMTSEALHGKEKGRERIRNAILGLLLLLGTYLILYTVNPSLLNFNLNVTGTGSSQPAPATAATPPPQPVKPQECLPPGAVTSGYDVVYGSDGIPMPLCASNTLEAQAPTPGQGGAPTIPPPVTTTGGAALSGQYRLVIDSAADGSEILPYTTFSSQQECQTKRAAVLQNCTAAQQCAAASAADCTLAK